MYTYLVWKNTETHFSCISRLLKCPTSETYKRTLQESVKLLEKGEINWEEIPKFEKFGTIFRLREKKGKLLVSSLSKLLDSRKKSKHMCYLFG